MHTRVGDCTYLLEPKRGAYFELNATGTLIWDSLADGPISLDELQAQLRKHSRKNRAPFRADLESFVQTMRSRGMVQVLD